MLIYLTPRYGLSDIGTRQPTGGVLQIVSDK
jgi:hypothetical protein